MQKPKLHVVSFSGGKDSTAMLLRMIEEDWPIDIILYCDTGLEFPEMYEHIEKVEKYIGRKITTIKADHDFMYYATEREVVRRVNSHAHKKGDVVYGHGWPSVFKRWCTSTLKRDVIKKFLRNYKDYTVIQYVGIAADEPNRVKDDKEYPLVKWNMSEADCLKYCYDRGFTWGGLYDHWTRLSCWRCPLQTLDNLRNLRQIKPDLWEQLKEMDKKFQNTPTPNFSKVSLSDIERRFEVEDEFIAAGKKLRTKEFFQALKDRGIRY